MFQDKKIFSLSSEGTGKNIEPGKLFSYDLKAKKVETLDLNIGAVQVKKYEYGYQYGLYDYYSHELRGKEYKAEAKEQMAELEAEELIVLKELANAQRQAAKSMDYEDVDELRRQLSDIESEKVALEWEIRE